VRERIESPDCSTQVRLPENPNVHNANYTKHADTFQYKENRPIAKLEHSKFTWWIGLPNRDVQAAYLESMVSETQRWWVWKVRS
jgi:hypothetical protein